MNRELCRKRRPTRDEDMMVWRVERGDWKLNWFVWGEMVEEVRSEVRESWTIAEVPSGRLGFISVPMILACRKYLGEELVNHLP